MADADHEAPTTEAREPIGAGEYIAPVLMRQAFHCMYCGVSHTPFVGRPVRRDLPGNAGDPAPTQRFKLTSLRRATCWNCKEESYWLAASPVPDMTEDPNAPMLWPWGAATAPLPDADMPADPKADYEEARAIVDRSPRGARRRSSGSRCRSSARPSASQGRTSTPT